MVKFPLRVAAIDLGSNAMRLLVAEFTSENTHIRLAEQRLPIRLGTSVFGAGGGRISDELLDDALEGLRSFRQRMDELKVETYRAGATSAVREAANGAELVQRAEREVDIRLDMISGYEEARLVWMAARPRLQSPGQRWFFVDLGGGSVEVGLAEGNEVLWSESHAMGSVRLLSELGDVKGSPARFRALAGEYVDTLISRSSLEVDVVAGLVATGGNIEELARLSGAPVSQGGAAQLSLIALNRTIDQLSGLSAHQRIDQLKLRPDRADVILPAALVYERIARLCGVQEITVPFVGLKEGLLLDAVQNVAQHQAHLDRQQREIFNVSLALGRRYLFDEAHARQVAQLSISLFNQLADRLGLTEADRLILLAAALLHDIGQYVSYRRHHKHSCYLISNSSLPDLTPRETRLAALVARYHRRAEPASDHEGYADLSSGDQERVASLAALLRVADALDRHHRQHVQAVLASVRGGVLSLDVTADGDLALETWALEKKTQLIKRLLGVEVAITISSKA